MAEQYNQFHPVLIRLAKQAGLYLREIFGKIKSVEFKGESNLVTNVDKASEQGIIKGIKEVFADHKILAEESGACQGTSEYKWIIDPLDGTTNFAHGFPIFSVSIALEYKGEIINAAVYDPSRDELFYAQKDQGAYCNSKKITISSQKSMQQSLLCTGFAYEKQARMQNVKLFTRFLSPRTGDSPTWISSIRFVLCCVRPI